MRVRPGGDAEVVWYGGPTPGDVVGDVAQRPARAPEIPAAGPRTLIVVAGPEDRAPAVDRRGYGAARKSALRQLEATCSN